MGGAVFVIKALFETSGLPRGEDTWPKDNGIEPIKPTKRKKRRVVCTAEVIRHDGESSKEFFSVLGRSPELRSHRQDSRHAELHSDAPAQFSLRTPGRNRSASANLP